METNKQELEEKVINAIGTIRPYLQSDGGDVVFKELTDDGVVKVQLQGACGSCPHAIATLKHGVEATVKKLVPEIKSVEAV
jgi:Fe-S cluster biogenesis protein NfuA